jgi:SAM-dependent methyltransferase
MQLEHGNYSSVAHDYAAHRAGYAPAIVDELLDATSASVGKTLRELDIADVGAGTGIWTRMLAERGSHLTAVEPDDAMRACGSVDRANGSIRWQCGRAEETGLESRSCDLLTMASAFHWADFDRAVLEFARVLRPRGWFAALWNTRVLDAAPFLNEVEAELRRRVPHYVPRSSGRSEFCAGLAGRLESCGPFDLVRYSEARHIARMSPERYLGIWRSVNDARVQAGEAIFAEFLAWVAERIRAEPAIDAPYSTLCWSARMA